MARSKDHPVLTPLPGGTDLDLVDALAQLSFAIQTALGRIAAAHDLSIVQARLLGILRDRQPTINELARLLELDKSSVTGLVDRAQERGLVQRIASTTDRRSVHVTITVEGQSLIDQGTAKFEAEIAVLVADLDKAEQSALTAAATLVIAADARKRGVESLDLAGGTAPGSTTSTRGSSAPGAKESPAEHRR